MTGEARAGDVFLAEILGQPGALRRAGASMLAGRDGLRALARVRSVTRSIVLTGMGSSYDGCHAVATILGGDGVQSTLVNTAELLHFRLPSLDPETLLVVVSQSGASAEVVRLLERVRERPARPFVVAVTNGLANPLAAGADLVLDTGAGPELGPSTMTFAGAVVVLAAMARVIGAGPAADVDAIARRTERDASAAAVAVETLLAAPEEAGRALLAWLGGRPTLTILGRGTGRATAEMAALTLKEAAGLAAESLESAAFRHGPYELVGPGLAAAVIAIEPATMELDQRLASELVEGGAAVLWVSTGDDTPPAGALAIRLGELDRSVAPAVALVPLQLLARELAIARGRRPGEFTRASKVTTRE